MRLPPSFVPTLKQLDAAVTTPDKPEEARYADLFFAIGLAQGLFLSALILEKIGPHVYDGPFKGMKLTPDALRHLFAPVLLGTYEQELHGVVEQIATHPYKRILNIGCSFGYYAVGFARRMPNTRVLAFDIDPKAREACAKSAAANDVGERIEIFGEFPGADFAKYTDAETFVLMDIEGAEDALLDPAAFPALQQMDVLVELHDVLDKTISKRIMDRFAPTHDIQFFRNRPQPFPLERIFGENAVLEHFDRMVVTMECRNGPTPWAYMTRKKPS
jgi:SAM-dependent methyltransferase